MATSLDENVEYSWVPTHYRVCRYITTTKRECELTLARKMAMPRELIEIKAPEEALYFPLSLKMLVASSVRKHSLPLSRLPEELKVLVNSTNAGIPHYVTKNRTCAQDEVNGDINVGNFGMFPTALFEAQATPGYLFRTNMLEQARAVMQFLISTQSEDPVSKLMKNDRIVRQVLSQRYSHFFQLQAEAFPKVALSSIPADEGSREEKEDTFS